MRAPCSRIVVSILVATAGVLLAYAAAARAEETVSEGAPITPEFAQTLYARVGPLREPDGCRLERFDTSQFYPRADKCGYDRKRVRRAK